MKTLGGLALAIAGAVGCVLVLLVVATLGLTGARSVRDGDVGEVIASTSTTVTSTDDLPVDDVTLRAGASEFEPPPEVLGVQDGDVLVVRVAGFEDDRGGTIAVCAADRCGLRFPVNFDDDGNALIQYRVDLARGCAGATTCRLELRSDDRIATAVLASGRSTGTKRGVVVGSRRVRADGAVAINVSGVDADRIRVLGCDRDARRRSECRELRFIDGRVVVDTGVNRLVILDRTTGLPIVSPVEVSVTGLRPSYDGVRLAVGLAVGAALLVAALMLVRRTEWREPASVTVWAD